MSVLTCTHRDHTIRASVMEHPGLPTPWAGGCQITDPAGHTSKRQTLPVDYAFMDELDKADMHTPGSS